MTSLLTFKFPEFKAVPSTQEDQIKIHIPFSQIRKLKLRDFPQTQALNLFSDCRPKALFTVRCYYQSISKLQVIHTCWFITSKRESFKCAFNHSVAWEEGSIRNGHTRLQFKKKKDYKFTLKGNNLSKTMNQLLSQFYSGFGEHKYTIVRMK